MAFRPNPIQYLKHGKLLSKKTAPTFVETWNWLCACANNACGDYDINPRECYITVDKRREDKPIIRLRIDRLVQALKDRFECEELPGCYDIEYDDEAEEYTLSNCYYRISGKTYEGPDTLPGDLESCILALKVTANSSSAPSATLETYANIAALNTAETDTEYIIIPLYTFDSEGAITCDWRKSALASMMEY